MALDPRSASPAPGLRGGTRRSTGTRVTRASDGGLLQRVVVGHVWSSVPAAGRVGGGGSSPSVSSQASTTIRPPSKVTGTDSRIHVDARLRQPRPVGAGAAARAPGTFASSVPGPRRAAHRDVRGDADADVDQHAAVAVGSHQPGQGELGALAPLARPAEPGRVPAGGRQVVDQDPAAPLRVVLVPRQVVDGERAREGRRLGGVRRAAGENAGTGGKPRGSVGGSPSTRGSPLVSGTAPASRLPCPARRAA